MKKLNTFNDTSEIQIKLNELLQEDNLFLDEGIENNGHYYAVRLHYTDNTFDYYNNVYFTAKVYKLNDHLYSVSLAFVPNNATKDSDYIEFAIKRSKRDEPVYDDEDGSPVIIASNSSPSTYSYGKLTIFDDDGIIDHIILNFDTKSALSINSNGLRVKAMFIINNLS